MAKKFMAKHGSGPLFTDTGFYPSHKHDVNPRAEPARAPAVVEPGSKLAHRDRHQAFPAVLIGIVVKLANIMLWGILVRARTRLSVRILKSRRSPPH